ncbi:1-propanol dehydrogenase PduQ [Fusobacterium sp. IOR10]|uniref:1-propanol dehydrogenase PduQ n=1 Tax=Fusobacterium sp. IOR10 TaxID=2665157 RepID=UPI0013D0F003|nr:1-propanol dehydrogenase PduQ [Fusobacterium sp. IOR10]
MKITNIKTKIYSGENSLEVLSNLKNERVFIVCDQYLVKSNIIKKILNMLNTTNKISIFSDVVPDPNLEVVGNGLVKFVKENPTIVICFGGGSSIDTGKGIIYFARLKKLCKNVTLIAIPTTSGTGSEVTSATVITDKEENIKHAIFDNKLTPDIAILDPIFTVTVPKKITANTGIDVLTHAIEAYVSKGSTFYSDAFSEKAFELVIKSLLKCYIEPNNIEARSMMMEASNMAGIAFNIAGLGVNHSIAHQLGAIYHIPHGLANAMVLKEIIKFNSRNSNVKKKYADLVYKSKMVDNYLDEDSAIKILQEYIDQIMTIMEMPKKISEFNKEIKINTNDLEIMKKNAMIDNCMKTTPVEISDLGIEIIIRNILK